nr:hypothetical protein [Deltaproteobacteria bacterium]
HLVNLLTTTETLVAKEGRLRAGRPEGVWKGYSEDGSLTVQGCYVRGIRHGRWTRFANGGKKAVEVNYFRGRVHGLAAWYDDGTPALQARFENGDLAPDWKVWRKDGRPLPASRFAAFARPASMRFVPNQPEEERSLTAEVVGSAG